MLMQYNQFNFVSQNDSCSQFQSSAIMPFTTHDLFRKFAQNEIGTGVSS